MSRLQFLLNVHGDRPLSMAPIHVQHEVYDSVSDLFALVAEKDLEFGRLADEIHNMESKLDDALADAKEANESLAMTKKSREEVASELDEANEKIRSLTDDVRVRDRQIAGLESKLGAAASAMSADVVRLSSLLSDARMEILDLAHMIAAKEARIAGLETTIAALNARLNDSSAATKSSASAKRSSSRLSLRILHDLLLLDRASDLGRGLADLERGLVSNTSLAPSSIARFKRERWAEQEHLRGIACYRITDLGRAALLHDAASRLTYVRGAWRVRDPKDAVRLSRVLVTLVDRRSGSVEVRPVTDLSGVGPECDLRPATRAEAEEHWQNPLDAGWRVLP